MLSYCLKCRKTTESKNPKVAKTKNGRIMLLSKCAVCVSFSRSSFVLIVINKLTQAIKWIK